MSDDDPVEAFVEGTVEPFGEDESERTGPQTRDMEAELRARTGVGDNVDSDAIQVDSETATAFWSAVIYVNAGVLLIAIGPVVYALRGRALVSAALVAAGAVALARAYSVYRAFDAEDGDEDGDEENGDDAPADNANDDETAESADA